MPEWIGKLIEWDEEGGRGIVASDAHGSIKITKTAVGSAVLECGDIVSIEVTSDGKTCSKVVPLNQKQNNDNKPIDKWDNPRGIVKDSDKEDKSVKDKSRGRSRSKSSSRSRDRRDRSKDKSRSRSRSKSRRRRDRSRSRSRRGRRRDRSRSRSRSRDRRDRRDRSRSRRRGRSSDRRRRDRTRSRSRSRRDRTRRDRSRTRSRSRDKRRNRSKSDSKDKKETKQGSIPTVVDKMESNEPSLPRLNTGSTCDEGDKAPDVEYTPQAVEINKGEVVTTCTDVKESSKSRGRSRSRSKRRRSRSRSRGRRDRRDRSRSRSRSRRGRRRDRSRSRRRDRSRSRTRDRRDRRDRSRSRRNRSRSKDRRRRRSRSRTRDRRDRSRDRRDRTRSRDRREKSQEKKQSEQPTTRPGGPQNKHDPNFPTAHLKSYMTIRDKPPPANIKEALDKIPQPYRGMKGIIVYSLRREKDLKGNGGAYAFIKVQNDEKEVFLNERALRATPEVGMGVLFDRGVQKGKFVALNCDIINVHTAFSKDFVDQCARISQQKIMAAMTAQRNAEHK